MLFAFFCILFVCLTAIHDIDRGCEPFKAVLMPKNLFL